MKGFIKVTEQDGFRVLIPVKEIKSVLETHDGAFIETNGTERRDIVGILAQENFDTVVEMISAA